MKKSVYLTVAMLAMASGLRAQDDSSFKIEAGADLVSSYVWRGLYQTAASLQPSISASAAGFTLGAWGSTDFVSPFKEFDFALTYTTGGLTLGATDYWWSGQGAPYFDKSQHLLEGSVGYHFGEKFPLYLGWNTMFAGNQDRGADDKQLYSTWVEAAYDFKVKEVACAAGVGITPWEGLYHHKFDVTCLRLKAAKEVQISDKYSLPVFVQMILSPSSSDAHLVLGMTF